MPTRNVMLTDHQAALLDRLVASGRFQNVSEAMRAGLRLLEDDEGKVEALNARLSAGLAEAEHGEFAKGSADEIFDRALTSALDRHDAQP